MEDAFWPPQIGDVWISDLQAEHPWPLVCTAPDSLTGPAGRFRAQTVWDRRGPLRLVWRDGAAVTGHHVSETADGEKTDELVHLTADVVAFSRGVFGENHVLLIRRRWGPFENSWALPGGHVDVGEETLEAGRRELAEETGLDAPRLDFVDAYADTGRDPRGRYVTFAYVTELEDLPAPAAADDAADARWVPLDEALADLFPLAFDHRQIIRDAADLAL